MTADNEACCNTPQTQAEWTLQGEFITMKTKVNGQERKAYLTGPKTAKRGVVALPDPFGFHKNTQRVHDHLATAGKGFQVCSPDLFPNGAMTDAMLANRENFYGWAMENLDFKKNHIYDASLAAVEELKAQGCTSFFITGPCMGTNIAVSAASEETSPFVGLWGPHPSRTDEALVKDIKCPVILFPCDGDADMVDVLAVINAKGFAVTSVQHKISAPHGFSGSRGDWGKEPDQLAKGMDMIQKVSDFFDQIVVA